MWNEIVWDSGNIASFILLLILEKIWNEMKEEQQMHHWSNRLLLCNFKSKSSLEFSSIYKKKVFSASAFYWMRLLSKDWNLLQINILDVLTLNWIYEISDKKFGNELSFVLSCWEIIHINYHSCQIIRASFIRFLQDCFHSLLGHPEPWAS